MKNASTAFAVVVILVAVCATAHATSAYSPQALQCFSAVENSSASFVTAVENQITLSIDNNLQAATSSCAGGFVCYGGVNNGKACATNADCGVTPGICSGSICSSGPRAGMFCVFDPECAASPSECQLDRSTGIAGGIAAAKFSLASNIAAQCSAPQRDELYGSLTTRCSPLTDSADLVDCIIRTSAGDIVPSGRQSDPLGEMPAQGAPNRAVDSPNVPTALCRVLLGSHTYAGTLAGGSPIPEFSVGDVISPLAVGSCSVNGSGETVCSTTGASIVGNQIASPISGRGSINFCITTRSLDAGNGTPEKGSINLTTGEQQSYAPATITVIIGRLCPMCSATVPNVCTPDPRDFLSNGGPNSSQPCNNPGATDVACPPTIPSIAPILLARTNLTTEATTVTIPANAPASGVTNPSRAFCGACDGDNTVGCQRDQDCLAHGDCLAGVGLGCCQFATTAGAFGDSSITHLAVSGIRNPFIPQLAAVACLGKTNSVVDVVTGLPGPMRSVEAQLNAFVYGPTPTAPTVAPGVTSTPTPTHTFRPPRPPRVPTHPVPFRCGTLSDCLDRCGSSPACNCECKNLLCFCKKSMGGLGPCEILPCEPF